MALRKDGALAAGKAIGWSDIAKGAVKANPVLLVYEGFGSPLGVFEIQRRFRSDGQFLEGAVSHLAKRAILLHTAFGYTPNQVTILDGLFIAIHVPSILKIGWRFNEDYNFYHDDLSSCLDAPDHTHSELPLHPYLKTHLDGSISPRQLWPPPQCVLVIEAANPLATSPRLPLGVIPFESIRRHGGPN